MTIANQSDDKPNPICIICTGWCESVMVNKEEWYKCRLCGNMFKVNRRNRTPL